MKSKDVNKRFAQEILHWSLWVMKVQMGKYKILDKSGAEGVKDTVWHESLEAILYEKTAEAIRQLLIRVLFVKFLPTHVHNEDPKKDRIDFFKGSLFIKDGISTRDYIYALDDYCYNLTTEYEKRDKERSGSECVKFISTDLFLGKLKITEGGETFFTNDMFFGGTGDQSIDLSKELEGKYKDVKIAGLIDIIKSYKFSLAEDTTEPDTLTPEIIGRIYEQSLINFNVNSKETRRKKSGSFYTPREVVQYMVADTYEKQISIKLQTNEGMNPMQANLVASTFCQHDARSYNTEELFFDILSSLTVMDPACGCGAFPIGTIYFIKNKLKSNCGLKLDSSQLKEIVKKCIFGVDIQPQAIAITKMRFYFFLLQADGNYDYDSLPDLSKNFWVANSLRELV